VATPVVQVHVLWELKTKHLEPKQKETKHVGNKHLLKRNFGKNTKRKQTTKTSEDHKKKQVHDVRHVCCKTPVVPRLLHCQLWLLYITCLLSQFTIVFTIMFYDCCLLLQLITYYFPCYFLLIRFSSSYVLIMYCTLLSISYAPLLFYHCYIVFAIISYSIIFFGGDRFAQSFPPPFKKKDQTPPTLQPSRY